MIFLIKDQTFLQPIKDIVGELTLMKIMQMHFRMAWTLLHTLHMLLHHFIQGITGKIFALLNLVYDTWMLNIKCSQFGQWQGCWDLLYWLVLVKNHFFPLMLISQHFYGIISLYIIVIDQMLSMFTVNLMKIRGFASINDSPATSFLFQWIKLLKDSKPVSFSIPF